MQWPARVAAAREGAMPAKAYMLAMPGKVAVLAKAPMLAALARVAKPAKVAILVEAAMIVKAPAGALMARMGGDSLRLTGAD